jgi:hypothetical protein
MAGVALGTLAFKVRNMMRRKKSIDVDAGSYVIDPYLEQSKREEKKTKKKPEPVVEKEEVKEEVLSSEYFKRLPKVRGWWRRRKALKNKSTTMLIRMELNNGRHREFTVQEDADMSASFRFNKKRYVLDLESKYYVVDSNLWAYDFHESFTLPIKRKIPVDDIKKHMEALGSYEIENAVNPSTLERLITSEIAQGIMRGAQLGSLFRLLIILVIITLIASIVSVLLGIYSSGVIDQLFNK